MNEVGKVMEKVNYEAFSEHSNSVLSAEDPVLYSLLKKDYYRQSDTSSLVASCTTMRAGSPACESSVLDNVTAEGYPGKRYHAGCINIDKIERLAIQRAKEAFGATYANVQPLSASIANQICIASFASPGDGIIGMRLDDGGHLSHGTKVNISGKHYNVMSYGTTCEGDVDFDALAEIAREFRPRIIIAGTTAYPRILNWEKFRKIADEVGAYFLADITHIAGLVAAGLHPSPINHAHVTTMCTHKQLYGPRGGIILSGIDSGTLLPSGKSIAETIDNGVFPFMQGAPIPSKLAAKAYILGHVATEEFHSTALAIRNRASDLAKYLGESGAQIRFGGTDNHMVIVDVLESYGVTGIVAQRALEDCGLIVNKNRIVGDTKPVRVGSGVRLGSNSISARGFTSASTKRVCQLFDKVLRSTKLVSDTDYELENYVIKMVGDEVRTLCRQHPLYSYHNQCTKADPEVKDAQT